MSKALLITGATGKQGRYVVEEVLNLPNASDYIILAVTRTADSPSATALAKKSPNIKLVEGNMDDPEAIFKTAATTTDVPIWGVFSVQNPMGGGQNSDSEERQGKALVDVALAHDVKHFVYTSVDRGGDERSWNNPTKVPHFLSKHNVEKHLKEAVSTQTGEMTYTILRPVAFMDNWTADFTGKGFGAMWTAGLPKSASLQLIACSDIGFFAAQAFAKPQEYKNKALGLAGDELTFAQANQVFKEKTGKDMPTTFTILGSAMLWGINELGSMFAWFKEEGYGADIPAIKKLNPKLKTLGDWLEKDGKYELKK
ncbi:MAG: hypothetical protein M1812_003049 [Candelaria pacifica]|nr:MAG: hypothetical protein M1812_003049 [Candelaria pacifica]